MKKLLFGTLTILLAANALAQDTIRIEKSVLNVQAGVLGVYISNEWRLANTLALRAETGLDYGFSDSQNTSLKWSFLPVIGVEPRYYYNLKKRNEKGYVTENNSANFFTLALRYNPDWFVISNDRDIKMEDTFYFIPKWGIRRSLGKGFHYEAGFGVGYYTISGKKRKYYNNPDGTAIDLHFRIGYSF